MPKQRRGFIYYIIYAIINSIMCVPCLYGYAAVIFNHEAFQSHTAALSKIVLLSSTVHGFCFVAFSTLPFAIGQVQDAGLIFLSAMSSKIADEIIKDGGTTDEILSTTIVTLGLATASLGVVLILMGKFKLADVVAYLPLPVRAGVALCISKAMVKFVDWSYLFDVRALLLALPGILAGVALTWISRLNNSAALPMSMVVIPSIFYIALLLSGSSIEDARAGGW
eukprot:4248920-Ditylum_brightwellii.AAC.1